MCAIVYISTKFFPIFKCSIIETFLSDIENEKRARERVRVRERGCRAVIKTAMTMRRPHSKAYGADTFKETVAVAEM